jgi:hypothetical protein
MLNVRFSMIVPTVMRSKAPLRFFVQHTRSAVSRACSASAHSAMRSARAEKHLGWTVLSAVTAIAGG